MTAENKPGDELSAAVTRWRRGYAIRYSQEHNDAVIITEALLDPTPITIEHLLELGFAGLEENVTDWLVCGSIYVRPFRGTPWRWNLDISHRLHDIPPPLSPTTLGELRQLMRRVQS